jgi:hypothetical protein
MSRQLAAAVCALVLASGCSDSGSATGSFGDNSGVLGCADLVVWGTVTSAEPADGKLKVTMDVEEWVYPASGDSRVTVTADDPAEQVGAPTWPSGTNPVLVVVSEVAPTQRLTAADGKKAVQQWRDAGSPRVLAEHCENA